MRSLRVFVAQQPAGVLVAAALSRAAQRSGHGLRRARYPRGALTPLRQHPSAKVLEHRRLRAASMNGARIGPSRASQRSPSWSEDGSTSNPRGLNPVTQSAEGVPPAQRSGANASPVGFGSREVEVQIQAEVANTQPPRVTAHSGPGWSGGPHPDPAPRSREPSAERPPAAGAVHRCRQSAGDARSRWP